MSAWIVNKENIDRIITAAQTLRDETWLPSDFVDSLSPWESDLDAFGTALWKMNVEAVKQRYGRPIKDLPGSPGSRLPKYHFTRSDVDIFQLLKSVQCFLYQCSEGDVPETDLYKFVRKIEDRLCHYCATTDSRYDAANWE